VVFLALERAHCRISGNVIAIHNVINHFDEFLAILTRGVLVSFDFVVACGLHNHGICEFELPQIAIVA
jgi:hypothetical protein